MGSCRKFEDILARYVHGDLLLQERDDLESHLSVCSACETLYREITGLDRVLRETREKLVDPPGYLRAKIIANLPEQEEAAGWSLWGRWAAAFGAVAACALVAVVLYRGIERKATQVASSPVETRQVEPAPAPAAPAPSTVAKGPEKASVPDSGKSSRGGVVASVPKVQIIREVKIYFYYPPAEKVAVTGDFNGWDPQGVPLQSGGKPGLWTTTLRLKPGAYSYNFIVDGNVLVPDPNAPDQMPDGYGGTNSILLVKGGNSV